MIVTAVREIVMPKSVTIISAISGVATENVVAVPASRANNANKSIILPKIP